MLEDVFRFRGCDIEACPDGALGLGRALEGAWDLVILDIMLPNLDGFSVCQRIRAAGIEVPILMLTAKGDEDDIVRGFEVGADDYVTKPFGVRELTARSMALLRKSVRAVAERFDFGPLLVDPENHRATDGRQQYTLTTRELRILRVLSLRPSDILSRRCLLRDAWDMNNAAGVETRTVDVHIAKLRKHLGPYGALIETVRGQGYRLRSP